MNLLFIIFESFTFFYTGYLSLVFMHHKITNSFIYKYFCEQTEFVISKRRIV